MIYLLPGFTLGQTPLLPLYLALQAQKHICHWLDLPSTAALEDYFNALYFHHSFTPNDVIIGWSLGGQIATLIAQNTGARLVTLASNPKFVTDKNWSIGISPQDFHTFCKEHIANIRANQRRFLALISMNSGVLNKRNIHQAILSTLETSSLIDSLHLKLLERLDTRGNIAKLSTPHLHLWAANDKLIQPAIINAFPQCHAYLIDGANHLLPYTHVDRVIFYIQNFLTS